MTARSGLHVFRLAVWGTALVVLTVGAGGMQFRYRSGVGWDSELFWDAASIAPFVLVGAFLVTRRPRNLVGWFLLAGGSAFAVHTAAVEYVSWSWVTGQIGEPAAVGAAWMVEWAWIPAWSLVFLGIAFVFPDGRLPSRRWRPVACIAVLLPSLQLVALALYPGPLRGLGDLSVVSTAPSPSAPGSPGAEVVLPDNPFGVAGAAAIFDVFDAVMQVAFLPLLVVAVVAQVVRYRRGDRTVRLQVRWLLFTVVAVLGLFLLAVLLSVWEDATGEISESIARVFDALVLIIAGYPVAIAVAVLRYRLYEIDRILNRTAVYTSVTIVLAAMYVGLVVGFQTLLRPYIGGRDLAVAAAPLAGAAACGPVRRRAQGVVDRRFDRARYDAQRTVEAFAQRLRHEVDLDALRDDLQSTVAQVMRPRLVGTWTAPRAGDSP
jgi:hypothetical protein